MGVYSVGAYSLGANSATPPISEPGNHALDWGPTLWGADNLTPPILEPVNHVFDWESTVCGPTVWKAHSLMPPMLEPGHHSLGWGSTVWGLTFTFFVGVPTLHGCEFSGLCGVLAQQTGHSAIKLFYGSCSE